jgi:hypothetical protein
MCPHTAGAFAKLFVMSEACGKACSMCVLILLYMCPYCVYVSAYCRGLCEAFRDARASGLWEGVLYVFSFYYMCPRTITYVSSYYFSCVLILLYMCPHTGICVLIYAGAFSKLCVLPETVSSFYYMCPHTSTYVSSCYYMQGPFRNFACCQRLCPHSTICVLILLHMCPHATICRGLFETLRAARDLWGGVR